MKKCRAAILFFLLVFFCADGRASDVSWEFAGWEGGGCYPNLEFAPGVQGRVYLTSDVAGIWRSDDLGENWRFATKGLGNLRVSLVAVAPSDPNILYAGTGGGVYRSHDAAESWQAADDAGGRIVFDRPDSYRSIAVSKTDPARVIAGTSLGEVFYSEDSGRKWELLGGRRPFKKPGAITALAWLEKEGVLYASSAQGTAYFSFSGTRWTLFSKSPRGITDLWAGQNTLYAVGQNRLFVSSDGGGSWKSGAPIPRGALFRLLVQDAGRGTMLAVWNDGWKGGVVKSDDGGEHWKPWDKTMNADTGSNPTRAWAGAHGRIASLKADPFNESILFRTDWWGVWRSDDGGLTWNEKIKGAPNSVATDVVVSEGGEIYAASMDDGLLRSSDGGETYQALFPDRGYADDANGHVWRVLVSGERLLATSTPWGTGLAQVILSGDRGANFQKMRSGLPGKNPKKNTVWDRGYPRALAVHSGRPEVVYLGIDGDDGGGFFVSRDGGRSWTRPEHQPGSLQIFNGLAVDPEDPQRILWGASGERSGVYLSEDGGKSWRLTEGSHEMKKIFDIAFGAGGRVYAAGEDPGPAVYFSEDRGLRWKLLKKFEAPGGAKGLCVLPDGRVAAGVTRWHGGAPGRVYLSSPDGRDWRDITGDLPEGEGPSTLAYDPAAGTLYLARFAGSVYKTKLDV